MPTKTIPATTAVTPPAASPPAPETAPPTPPAPPGATTPPLITGTANNANHGTKVDLQALYSSLIAGLLAIYQPTDSVRAEERDVHA